MLTTKLSLFYLPNYLQWKKVIITKRTSFLLTGQIFSASITCVINVWKKINWTKEPSDLKLSCFFASLQSFDSCLLLNNKVPLGACSSPVIMWSLATLAARRFWNSSSVSWLLQRKRSAGVQLASRIFWLKVSWDLMGKRPTDSCLHS